MRRAYRRYGRAARPLSAAEKSHLIRWYGRKYGLTDSEALRLGGSRRSAAIEQRLDKWRARNGLPPSSSPLSRGMLRDIMKEEGV